MNKVGRVKSLVLMRIAYFLIREIALIPEFVFDPLSLICLVFFVEILAKVLLEPIVHGFFSFSKNLLFLFGVFELTSYGFVFYEFILFLKGEN